MSDEGELKEKALGILLEQITKQLTELSKEVHSIGLRLQDGDARMGRIEASIANHTNDEKKWADTIKSDLIKNTEATQVIADGTVTLRVIRSAIIWIGGVAGGIAGVVYLFGAFSGTSIGPGP